MKTSVVVLISGSGSNLQSLIDGMKSDQLPIQIRAVISNRSDAFGLQRAKQAGIKTAVLSHMDYAQREDYDQALIQLIDQFEPQLVVLAGFMRILSPKFVHHYQGRLLNIHPSLLPKYRGLNTHQRALASGDKQHGASVHFVTEELDGGPVIIQAKVPILAEDDAERLAARVLKKEHCIYPLAVKWFAEGRLHYQNNQAYLDGHILNSPVQYED